MLNQLIQTELLKEIYTVSTEVENVRRNSSGAPQPPPSSVPVVPCSVSKIFHAPINENAPAGFADLQQLPIWETLGQACQF
jgi:hypothetical protein